MADVTISWDADPVTDNVTGYQVWGANGTSVGFGSCAKLATVTGLTWTDVGLPNSQPRTYYIVAVNAVGASAPEGPINITTAAPSAVYVQRAGDTMTGPLVLSADPSTALQAATKQYVDAKVAGLSWKQAVRAATTSAHTLATDYENGDVIDGVTLATGDRILIKNQSSASENGIYVVAASGAPARASDADSGAELVNASVYVSEGTANADSQWTCTTNAPITIGSTALAFAQLTSTGGSLQIANNLSDLANAGTARTNLGVAIGSNVQAYSSNLDALAALSATGAFYYLSAPNTWSAVTIGTGLSFSSGALSVTGFATSGAVTGSGLTMATSRLLGRTTASTGPVEEISVGTGLTLTSGSLAADLATAAQYQGNTASKVLSTDKVWSAADYVALTDAATVAVDMSLGFKFYITLGGNRALGNPTNTKGGQSGVIEIIQDGTGGRTLSFGSNWKFSNGAPPTLTATPGAKDYLFYEVRSSTLIVASLLKDVR